MSFKSRIIVIAKNYEYATIENNVIKDGTVKVLVPDDEFKEKWELTNDGYAKPKPIIEKPKPIIEKPKPTIEKETNDIEERIARKLREASRTKSNILKRKMAREERKRRLRLK